MGKNYGKVNYKGKVIKLTQDAYIAGSVDDTPYYEARGVDDDGNNYMIYWNIKEGYEDHEDESECCD